MLVLLSLANVQCIVKRDLIISDLSIRQSVVVSTEPDQSVQILTPNVIFFSFNMNIQFTML